MGTRMKGVFKGLRFITQIFEDGKEPEMKIGLPTDVKHVSHIGLDGPSPSVDNSPSWMKEFKTPEGHHTASELDVGRGSQDYSSQKSPAPRANPSRGLLPDLPKSSRRRLLAEGSSTSTGSPKGISKSRQSRRNPSDSSKSTRKQKDQGLVSSSPRRSSRNKSKESSAGEGFLRSRSKAASKRYSSPFSDPGPDIHGVR